VFEHRRVTLFLWWRKIGLEQPFYFPEMIPLQHHSSPGSISELQDSGRRRIGRCFVWSLWFKLKLGFNMGDPKISWCIIIFFCLNCNFGVCPALWTNHVGWITRAVMVISIPFATDAADVFIKFVNKQLWWLWCAQCSFEWHNHSSHRCIWCWLLVAPWTKLDHGSNQQQINKPYSFAVPTDMI
jgi:hypothetical protein